MNAQNSRKILAIVLVCSIIAVTATSFQDAPALKPSEFTKVQSDTPRKNIHIDIDLKELNTALDKMNIELKGIKWDEISKEIDVALSSINVDKIKLEVNQSLQSIDWEQIKNDINNSVKDINVDEIRLNIQKVTDGIKTDLNSEKFKKDIRNLKKAGTNKIKSTDKKQQDLIDKNNEQILKNLEELKEDANEESTHVAPPVKVVQTASLPYSDRLFFLI